VEKEQRKIEVGYDTWYEIERTNKTIEYHYYSDGMFYSDVYKLVFERTATGTHFVEAARSFDGGKWESPDKDWFEEEIKKAKAILIADARNIFNTKPGSPKQRKLWEE